MTGHRIVFLDRATIPADMSIRPPDFPHEWVNHERTAPEDVVARCEGASIVITNKVPIREDAMASLPALGMIAVAATGTDIVDLKAAAEHGIVVSNVRGYAAKSVPEHVLALILALRRNVIAYRESVANGAWQRAGQFCFFDHRIEELSGATLGIIGAGSIGASVAKLGAAFGMEVLLSERKGASDIRDGRVPFGDVLARSDVLTLHCPLTIETRHLLDADAFAAMTRRPIVINTARGGLIDDAALVAALENGRIAGAAIDVTVPEPPPDDHPFMRLSGRGDFILTPHVAWASRTAIAALVEQMVGNLEAFVAGKPRNVVKG